MADKETVPNLSDKKTNKTLNLLLFGFVVVLIYSVICTIDDVKYRAKVSSLENEVISLKDRRGKQDEFLQDQSSKRQEAEQELEKLKKRIENIKSLDDLLERDIKLYIKNNYKKVPRSVAEHIAANAMKFGKKYNISPILLVGIIQVESGFNPMITGPKTKYGFARGLMQVMPEWVKKMGLDSTFDLYDIDVNIETGCKVWLIHLEEENGNISKGLFKYVNGDKKYASDVYNAMGKFVAFRSTVDDGKEQELSSGDDEKPPTDEETPIQINKEVKDPKE